MSEQQPPEQQPPEQREPGDNGPAGSQGDGARKPRWAAARLPTGRRTPGRSQPPLSPSRRWLLVAGGVLFVVLFVLVAVRGLRGGPNLPPRTVEDQEFVRQANSACSRSLPALRRDRERRRTGDEGREAALAGTVERAADELERLAGEVRALPVAPADQADVQDWLGDWDAYVATGRRFAEALRRSDERSYDDISAQSTELSERIYGFSVANGLSECVF
jgi:hypothetical protein